MMVGNRGFPRLTSGAARTLASWFVRRETLVWPRGVRCRSSSGRSSTIKVQKLHDLRSVERRSKFLKALDIFLRSVTLPHCLGPPNRDKHIIPLSGFRQPRWCVWELDGPDLRKSEGHSCATISSKIDRSLLNVFRSEREEQGMRPLG